MSETRAYALAEGYEELSGGVIALGPEGDSLDVKKALDDGGGLIATRDPLVAVALDLYPAVESVDASEVPGGQELIGTDPDAAQATDPDAHTKEELKALAASTEGVDLSNASTKVEIAAAIDAARARLAAGEEPAADGDGNDNQGGGE